MPPAVLRSRALCPKVRNLEEEETKAAFGTDELETRVWANKRCERREGRRRWQPGSPAGSSSCGSRRDTHGFPGPCAGLTTASRTLDAGRRQVGGRAGTMDNFFPEVSALAAPRGSLPAPTWPRAPGGGDRPAASRARRVASAKPERAKLSGSRLKASSPAPTWGSLGMSKPRQVLFRPALPLCPGGSQGELPFAWVAGSPVSPRCPALGKAAGPGARPGHLLARLTAWVQEAQ